MLIATCDDEIEYCEQVECFLTRLGESLGIEIKCDKYCSGYELLKSNFNQYKIIYMMNGEKHMNRELQYNLR